MLFEHVYMYIPNKRDTALKNIILILTYLYISQSQDYWRKFLGTVLEVFQTEENIPHLRKVLIASVMVH